MPIDLTQNEVDVICMALDFMLDDYESKKKTLSSATEKSELMSLMQIVRDVKKTFEQHKDFKVSALCTVFLALEPFKSFLEEEIPNMSGDTRNTAIETHHQANRLIRKIKPICEPLISECESAYLE